MVIRLAMLSLTVASAFLISKGPANLRLFERFLAEAVKKVGTLREIAVNNSHNYLFIVNPPLGAYLFQTHLRRGLNRDGGAYLI